MDVDVAIVGAGLAGLACARQLTLQGASVAVLEASDRVGGRVATDEHEGFLLDRGFQVLLSSYPEAKRVFDFPALEPGAFRAGSLVHRAGRSWRVVDPWRAPLRGLATLRAPFVTLGDAVRMARLRRDAVVGNREERGTAAELLRRRGFSQPLREAFLRPFLSGITLDPTLEVPAWYMLDLFRWFSTGEAVLPARGMRALPEQLASDLPESSLHLDSRVRAVGERSVELETGSRIEAGAVVLAVDGGAAQRLLGRPESPTWSGSTTLHYAAESSPVGEPILVLNGDGSRDGPVNHLCVVSDAQPSYAPAGAALVSVSVLGVPERDEPGLERAVRFQLTRWYGPAVRAWRLLRIDRIPRALPRRFATSPGPLATAPERGGVLICGDHVATPSIQGALGSGRRAAEAALQRIPQRS